MSVPGTNVPFVTGSVTSPADGQEGGRTKKSGRRVSADWGRRAVAGLVVLVGGVMLLAGQVADVCRDEVAGSTVVQVCEPIGLTDPRIVWALLVVVLLLLPDVSELELAGVLSLKRAVAQVEGQAELLRGEAQRASAALSAVTQQLAVQATAQGQSQQLVVQMPPPAAQVNDFIADIELGDTGALSVDEEEGGYRSLLATSALAGMVTDLFAPWAGRVDLVGWIRSSTEGWRVDQVAGAVDADVLSEIGESLGLGDPADGPVVTDTSTGAMAVTAISTVIEAATGAVHVTGALTVLLDEADPSVDDLSDVAAKVTVAAGAYGLLLRRVLGEPSTLEPSPPKEQP